MTSGDVVELKNGRRLAVHIVVEGTADRTVVLCHAAPGSGLFDPDPEATWARGVTLLGVDRPGYGGSDPAPPGEWPGVDRTADELAEALDQLGVERAGVAGWAGGGLVALALAARRPDLVDRLVIIGTPAPDSEVPWIPPALRSVLEAAAGQDPEQAHETLTRLVGPLLSTDPDDWMGLLDAGNADATALEVPAARQRLVAMLRSAFIQGPAGLAADITSTCLRPWAFEPAEVRAKTLLLYGAQDPLAAPRHGKWWQARLPDARYEQIPAAGHLLILNTWRRALSHLAPHTKR
jgi:pimeloyl-ACP methyl ester carboxylesterase